MAYRDRNEDYGGHPGIATGICAFLLLASLAGGSASHTVRNNAELAGYILGGGAVGATLWGISYAITIKLASPGWKAGSLIALIVLGLFVSLVKVRSHGAALRKDVAAAHEQMQGVLTNGLDAGPVIPASDAGPLARMSAVSTNVLLAEARAFETEEKAAGLPQLLAFKDITKSSPVLDHCDRVAALTERASHAKGRFPDYIATARKEGEAAIAAGTLQQTDLDAFFEGADKGRVNYERQWTLLGQVTTDGAVLCRLLARRHWQHGPGGKILFPNAELREVQPILARLQKASDEIEQIRSKARDSLQRGMAELDKI